MCKKSLEKLRRQLKLALMLAFISLAPAGQDLFAQTPGANSCNGVTEELKQIRAQLARIEERLAAAFPGEDTAKVNVAGSHSLGRGDAPVTLIEFADYQCPYCRMFHLKAFQRLRKDYIDTGKLRFVALNLPLDIHPGAFKGAEAALCAGEQSKFWEMRDLLLTNPSTLSNETLLGYATQLGLDEDLFRSCLEDGRLAVQVKADMAQADDLDISSTPTFILGRTQNDKVEGVKLPGAQSYSQLEHLIKGLLDPRPQNSK